MITHNRRTKHKGSAVVASIFTYTIIREAVDAFTGYSPRCGTAQIGPVWCAIGPTCREAMMDSKVMAMMAGSSAADDFTFTAADMRAVRRAFFRECEAQGFGVFSNEPFFTPET